MFGIRSGSVLLKIRFDTEAEAASWADMNSRSRGGYVIVPLRDEPSDRSDQCNCENQTGPRWKCPKHGEIIIDPLDLEEARTRGILRRPPIILATRSAKPCAMP